MIFRTTFQAVVTSRGTSHRKISAASRTLSAATQPDALCRRAEQTETPLTNRYISHWHEWLVPDILRCYEQLRPVSTRVARDSSFPVPVSDSVLRQLIGAVDAVVHRSGNCSVFISFVSVWPLRTVCCDAVPMIEWICKQTTIWRVDDNDVKVAGRSHCGTQPGTASRPVPEAPR